MRTTVDIPDQLLRDVQEMTGAATRRDALIQALEDYIRRQRIQRVIDVAGTLEFDVDIRELRNRDRKRLG
jgi:hypothetical protein